MSLFIKNPHSVLAALETRPQDVLEVVIAPREMGKASSRESSRESGRDCGRDSRDLPDLPDLPDLEDIWRRVQQIALKSRVPVSAQPRKELGGGRKNFNKNKAMTRPDESSRMGGTGATIKERSGLSVEELFRLSAPETALSQLVQGRSAEKSRAQSENKSSEKPAHKSGSSTETNYGIWLALDSLQDPQNVGAIFRSAAFFGIRGILLTQERSAPLTAAVYDIASGGAEYVPFSIQSNLQRSFDVAKDAGLWILGTSEHAHDSFLKVERDRSWLIVLGNEEKGMRRLTEESCDVLCGIPSLGKLGSLNVSVAAGILLSHFAIA